MAERNFRGSLNSIISLRESTCEDKWNLAVQTALPALGSALFVLIVPSPDEILEEYLHPRLRRGQAKRQIMSSGRRGVGRTGIERWLPLRWIPDVDSLIARMIPGSDIFAGRTVGGPEKWLWTGIDILDRISWYWLLIDIGENFIHYWASNIMNSKFCTGPADKYFSSERNTTGNWNSLDVNSNAANPIIHAQKNITRASNGILTPVGGHAGKTTVFRFTGSFHYVRQSGSSEPTTRLRIAVNRDTGLEIYETEPTQIQNNTTKNLDVAASIEGQWTNVQFILASVGGSFNAASTSHTECTVWES